MAGIVQKGVQPPLNIPVAILVCSQLLAICGAMAASLPNISRDIREGFDAYRQGETHRAFVISPSGVWAWLGEAPTAETALDAALKSCQERSVLPCVPYARDDEVVFDTQAWPTLWRPYPNDAEAVAARTGVKRGERAPDLSCTDDKGRATRLSDLRGKLVVLHFWGSWCGPCRRELPNLLKLRDQFRKEPRVAFVFVQVREDAKRSRAWLKAQKLNMPVCDSGVHDDHDEGLHLADGGVLKDRQIAAYFPSTLILDRHGVVLFSRAGPAPDWGEYLPFIRDALRSH